MVKKGETMKEYVKVSNILISFMQMSNDNRFIGSYETNQRIYGMCDIICRYIAIKENEKTEKGETLVNVDELIKVFMFLYDNDILIHDSSNKKEDVLYQILGVITYHAL